MLWLPLVEFFGRIALRYGIVFLEKKYPGVKPIIDLIMQWLQSQAAQGNPKAVQALTEHVQGFCSSTGCPPHLVGE